MANYLARVAASGAASRSHARPAVVAPPILPGRGVSSEAERPGNPINRPGQIPDARFPVSDAPIRPTESASTPMPGSQTKNANLIRAPRPLEKLGGAGATPPQPFPLTPSSEGVIHAPKSFSMTQMPRFFDSAQSPGKDREPQRQEPVFAPASSVDIELPVQTSPRQGFEPAWQQIVDPATESMGARPDAPQVPAASAMVDLPINGATARREPKITIGQIDVQVINTPAPAQVPAAPSAVADSKGFMSAELDRFRWRLR
jgi:hypothetical protein